MNNSEIIKRARQLLSNPTRAVAVPSVGLPFRLSRRIEWVRAGCVQHGTIDFVHVEVDGTAWAFVTLGESWSAVNMNVVKDQPQAQ